MTAERQIVIVLGMTGMGKSEWTRQYTASTPRLFVADPLASYPVQWVSHEELISAYDAGQFSNGKNFRTGTYQREDIELSGALAFLSGDNCMVIEECSTVFEPGARALPSWANDMVFLGRHRRCSLVFTAQRAASIPIAVRSQAHRVVTFKQHEGDDLKWLRPYLGERINDLPHLGDHVCLDSSGSDVSEYSLTLKKS